jgi:pimeloyl-ACP methyl ester carboxylesterase
MSDLIEPFKLNISDEVLKDLRQRLAQTRWPERETVDDWAQGAPLANVQALCEYWQRDYDWRRCEAKLNALGQYRTHIDGLGFHFLHVPSPHANALPLIMTHGWPGSVIEFLRVIEPLSRPELHGGDPNDAFHVVAPSLPGYGFSDKPSRSGWTVERIGKAWIELMRRLGYKRFVAQGGDWGSAVTTAIAMARPPECAGIHLNMPIAFPVADDFAHLTDAEKATVASMQFYEKSDSGYAKQQGTRPQTLGYGLSDSPAGQAAWIYEKFYAWTDNTGTPETALSRDQMLDNIMLYWLPANSASSGRLYWESAGSFKSTTLELPVGVSIFPKEIFRPSRRWAERGYKNIIHWNEVAHGGHFAAFEQPTIFVDEVRTCFRQLR